MKNKKDEKYFKKLKWYVSENDTKDRDLQMSRGFPKGKFLIDIEDTNSSDVVDLQNPPSGIDPELLVIFDDMFKELNIFPVISKFKKEVWNKEIVDFLVYRGKMTQEELENELKKRGINVITDNYDEEDDYDDYDDYMREPIKNFSNFNDVDYAKDYTWQVEEVEDDNFDIIVRVLDKYGELCDEDMYSLYGDILSELELTEEFPSFLAHIGNLSKEKIYQVLKKNGFNAKLITDKRKLFN